MPRRLKQQFWIIPLAIAGLVALFGWWGNARLRDTVKSQLEAKLKSTLEANVTALEIWTTNQTRLAMTLAEEQRVRTLATQIFDSPVQQQQPGIRRPANQPEMEELNNYLRPRLTQLGYEIAQLVNTNFITAANLGRPRLPPGMPVSDAHTNKFSELFGSGQPILITPFKVEPPGPRRGSPFRGRNENGRGPRGQGRAPFDFRGVADLQRRRGDITLMQVAAPIRDTNGIVRGALALVINPTNEFTRILSVAQSGKSGETYAFDQTGLLISQSRFDEQLKQIRLLDETNFSSALNLRLHDPGGDLTRGFKLATNDFSARPLTHIVAEAVAGEDGVDLQPSRDYRGVPVVGAWRWLPDAGFWHRHAD